MQAQLADEAGKLTEMQPLDYVLLSAPLVFYALFYVWRDMNDVRAPRRPCTLTASDSSCSPAAAQAWRLWPAAAAI